MIPGPSSLLLFVSAALLLLVVPGPAVCYIVGRSIGQGRSAGLVSALGISVGSLIHTAAAAVVHTPWPAAAVAREQRRQAVLLLTILYNPPPFS